MPRPAPHRVAVWVPVVVALVVQLGTTAGVLGAHGGWRRQSAGPGTMAAAGAHPLLIALAVLLALAGPALLVVIRRRPGPVLVAVAAIAAAGVALFAALGLTSPLYLSVLFAVVIAVLHGARLWAWPTVGALWLDAVTWTLSSPTALPLPWLVPLTVIAVASLAIPEVARSRRARIVEEHRRDEARRDAAEQAERVRIARELHDVLAHSLSLINVQASVGLHLFEQRPEQAAEALAAIKKSSRTALAEVRQVLGVLRNDGDDEVPLVPEPGLSRLPELVAGARTQGVEVELRDELDAVPAPAQSALYRIVQEALTNVMKHAGAHRVLVVLDEEGGDYRVSVRDDGHGPATPADGRGRGLLGMRERAELLGGSFRAGPAAGGGFEVSARIPRGGGA